MKTFSWLFVLVSLCIVSCRSSAPQDSTADSSEPLPDLVIKRVTYQIDLSTPRLIPQRVDVVAVPFQFRVQVENDGNAPFSDPFYLSFTTTQSDYKNLVYSRHERLNDAHIVIAPGKSYTFAVSAEIEILRREAMMNVPMRFYINTEGLLNLTGFQAPVVKERSYRNNVFELSMRPVTRSR